MKVTGGDLVYQSMKRAYARVEQKIEEIQQELEHFPAGKLICTNNGTRDKWYHKDEGKLTYIPKCNRALAEQLVQKAQKQLTLQDLENERKAIQAYLHCRKPVDFSEKLYKNPGLVRLLSAEHWSISGELSAWMCAPYEKNPFHPEGKIHQCCTGEFVRSKSESMIALALHLHKIPFRYECALRVGPNVAYPDFTIRHPVTGRTYYWENFGMMDVVAYRDKVSLKLKYYISQGIIPSDQLITTYEKQDKPLSSARVESLIEEFFGSGA